MLSMHLVNMTIVMHQFVHLKLRYLQHLHLLAHLAVRQSSAWAKVIEPFRARRPRFPNPYPTPLRPAAMMAPPVPNHASKQHIGRPRRPRLDALRQASPVATLAALGIAAVACMAVVRVVPVLASPIPRVGKGRASLFMNAHTTQTALAAQEYAESVAKLSAVRKTLTINPSADTPRFNSEQLVWDLYPANFNCPGIRSRLGNVGDGGKWVCDVDGLLQHPGCVVYSLGSNGDVTFEADLLNHTHCDVHTFDPTTTMTPAKQAAVRAVVGQDNFHACAVGVADEDVPGKMRTKALATVMRELGHQWIDVLKMDIEVAEWTVLPAWLQGGADLPASQVCQSVAQTQGGLRGLLVMVVGRLMNGGHSAFLEDDFCDAPRNALDDEAGSLRILFYFLGNRTHNVGTRVHSHFHFACTILLTLPPFPKTLHSCWSSSTWCPRSRLAPSCPPWTLCWLPVTVCSMWSPITMATDPALLRSRSSKCMLTAPSTLGRACRDISWVCAEKEAEGLCRVFGFGCFTTMH